MFEKFTRVSVIEFGNNPSYCVSLPGYTWQFVSKFTRISLQTFQDKDLILTLENNVRGGMNSILGDRCVKSDDNKKYCLLIQIICMVTQCLNHYLMMKLKLIKNVNLEDILITPDDSDNSYFLEVDLIYPDNIKEKLKNFPFAPENKKN